MVIEPIIELMVMKLFCGAGDPSLADYYKQILDIFKFEPRKKCVEEETDESNTTSISDISDKNEDGKDNDDEVVEYENPTVNEASVASFSIDNFGPITSLSISSSKSFKSVLTTFT